MFFKGSVAGNKAAIKNKMAWFPCLGCNRILLSNITNGKKSNESSGSKKIKLIRVKNGMVLTIPFLTWRDYWEYFLLKIKTIININQKGY